MATADDLFASGTDWQPERSRLRDIVLDCGLEETIKWKQPCYRAFESNLLIVSNLKDCASLSFFTGSLLKDPKGLLIIPDENSQAARWMKFTSVAQVDAQESDIRDFIAQALALKKAGVKVEFSKSHILDICDELQDKMDADPDFERAFTALTTGRKRGYCLHFNAAKQSATRVNRITKHAPRILQGKGMHDR